jgi:hypothetical protein
VPLTVLAAFAVGWIVWAHALDLLPVGVKATETGTPLAASILGNTATWLQQMVGIFGWLDTLSPLLTYLVWYGVVGLFFLLALSSAKARHVAALLVLVAIVIFVPVAISYGQAHRLGIIWQARYIMPMAVGVPLMAVALVERSVALRGVRARVATVTCAALALGSFVAFGEALRRYVTGVAGPIDYLHAGHKVWHPPLGALALTIVAFVVIALSAAFVRYLVAIELVRSASGPATLFPVGAADIAHSPFEQGEPLRSGSSGRSGAG